MKCRETIIKYGKIKTYDKNKSYKFCSLDLETIDNQLFLLGYIYNNKYVYFQDNFFENTIRLIINCARSNQNIITWSRYDGTFIIKLILNNFLSVDKQKNILEKVGKVENFFTFTYKGFSIVLQNLISDSLIISIIDRYKKKRNVVIYNIKNIFQCNLVTASKIYNIEYSKIGQEFHVIDKTRFFTDLNYQAGVIRANYYDNKVLIELMTKFLDNYKEIAGKLPYSIFSCGSLARSFLKIKYENNDIDLSFLNFNNYYNGNLKDKLLDFTMSSYHGGKIDSYVLGAVDNAYIIDITSAYPYQISQLYLPTQKIKLINENELNNYFYAFINCDIFIDNPDFSHPIIVTNPVTKTNISPYGSFNTTITKIEYDFLKSNNINVVVKEIIAVEHRHIKPFNKLINELFKKRIEYNQTNRALADTIKRILNSMYGITYELTPLYNNNLMLTGYRAGDFFNPLIASYITAMTRTQIASVNNYIINRGGKILLNMTDSIMYMGNNIDMSTFCSDKKILGKFDSPKSLTDIVILGSGRYEYKIAKTDFINIKTRGFKIETSKNTFYKNFNINKKFSIKKSLFVSCYKATTQLYNPYDLGKIVETEYNINPLALGGKRILKESEIKCTNLNQSYINTYPIKLDINLNLKYTD